MALTKEKAIAYFHEKAPKKLRNEGIVGAIEELRKGDESIYIFNENYWIRYMVPEAYNSFMRNQNFKPTLKGILLTKKDARLYRESYLKKGYKIVIHLSFRSLT